MNYRFNIDNNHFNLQLPSSFLEIDKLRNTIDNNHCDLKIDMTHNDDLTTIVGKSDNNIENDLREFFSHMNNIPVYCRPAIDNFKNHNKPLVSCIILLTFNDLFTINQIIPSIIRNSKNYPIEIIIAYNGSGCDITKLSNLKVINTEQYRVASSYNTAIKQADGEYIALFHDDCLLCSPDWIEVAIDSLSNNTLAITAEFDKETAKFVPLFMKYSTIEKMGYLDEYYFFGIEDMDLTFNIYQHGYGITKAIKAIHFKGMSTILLYSDNRNLFKLLFMYNILPITTIRMIQQICLKNALLNGLGNLTKHYVKHFIDKFGPIIKDRHPELYKRIYFEPNNKEMHHEIIDDAKMIDFITSEKQKTSFQQIASEMKALKK